MLDTMPKIKPKTLYVVEVGDKAHLGTVHRYYTEVTIKTHIAGRPVVVPVREIDAITPAAEHPDVVEI